MACGGLLAAILAKRLASKERIAYQYQPLQLLALDNGELEAKIAELERLYHLS